MSSTGRPLAGEPRLGGKRFSHHVGCGSRAKGRTASLIGTVPTATYARERLGEPAHAAPESDRALLANAMFALPTFEVSTKTRSSGPLWLADVVATVGLVVVILGVVRSDRAAVVPFAVGAYIGAAYFFTSSTSFANPAVTIGRTITNTLC